MLLRRGLHAADQVLDQVPSEETFTLSAGLQISIARFAMFLTGMQS